MFDFIEKLQQLREKTMSSYRLFINVRTNKTILKDLSEVVHLCAVRICNSNKVADVRLIEYGKGKALLHSLLTEVELSGDYYLDRNSEFYGVCMDALSSDATEIFYGL